MAIFVRTAFASAVHLEAARQAEEVRELLLKREDQGATRNAPDGATNEGLELQREFMEKVARNNRLQDVLKHATLIDDPTSTRTVEIGTIVTLVIEYDGRDEERKRYFVGGYDEIDDKAFPPIFSYKSPIIAAVLGQGVGYATNVTLPAGHATVEILKIELPPKAATKPRFEIVRKVKAA